MRRLIGKRVLLVLLLGSLLILVDYIVFVLRVDNQMTRCDDYDPAYVPDESIRSAVCNEEISSWLGELMG